MTLWFIIVVSAQLFYALIFIIDKYVLSRPLVHPVNYAFYVGFLSIFVLVLIPFGFSWPSVNQIILCIFAGAVQVGGLYLLYKAIWLEEVSRVVPFIDALGAIFVLFLSTLLIGEHLTGQQLMAFAFLVSGCLVVSYKGKKEIFSRANKLSILAAFLFAIFWVITKYVFSGTSFISGLVWIRVATALMALFLLIPRKNRDLIFAKKEKKKIDQKSAFFFFLARILSIVGALFVYWAVFLGSVTLTNSLQGLRYAFILLIAFLFYKKIPGLKEHLSRKIIVQKIVAVILIGMGLFILII